MVGGRIGDRLHRQHPGAWVIGEWNAEPFTIGWRDQRKLGPTWRAKPVPAYRFAARRAKRRQRHIQRPAEKRTERRGSAGKAGGFAGRVCVLRR